MVLKSGIVRRAEKQAQAALKKSAVRSAERSEAQVQIF